MDIVRKTEKYYKHLNTTNGPGSPKNLWQNQERQILRFKKSIEIVDFANSTILDVGCGYGDFYEYLINKNITPKSYTGIDLLNEHCNVARQRLPITCDIICGDFLQKELKKSEYCILSGTLNYYDKEWFVFAHKVIDKMWSLAHTGIIFNIRSPKSMHSAPELSARQHKDLSPSYWCSYAESMTTRYALFHDYVDYDYTIAMWKEKSDE